MTEKYKSRAGSVIESADGAVAVTTSDSVDLAEVTRGIYVGGTGNLKVHMASGAEVTFTGVPAGSVLPLRVRRVLATGTTATQIVGLY